MVLAAALPSSVTAVAACGDESFTGADAAPIDAGGGDVTVDAVSVAETGSDASVENEAAPAPCPADMVMFTSVADRRFCVDRFEASQAEYKSFLAANVAPSSQPTQCSWNVDFVPTSSPECNVEPTSRGAYPIVCIDWCDARAYCEWRGKRLCGSLADGGATPPGAPGEYAAACSKNGTLKFGYGNDFDASICNGEEKRDSSVAMVDADLDCVGGAAGLVNMMGNVKEWVNECDEVASAISDDCFANGGSYKNVNLECERSDNQDMGWKLPDIGLRCCKNAE